MTNTLRVIVRRAERGPGRVLTTTVVAMSALTCLQLGQLAAGGDPETILPASVVHITPHNTINLTEE